MKMWCLFKRDMPKEKNNKELCSKLSHVKELSNSNCHCVCVQLNHPDLVDGLVLLNINPNADGIMDSVANKVCWTRSKSVTCCYFQSTQLFGLPDLICCCWCLCCKHIKGSKRSWMQCCVCLLCVIDHWMDPHCPRHSHHTLVWKG